MDIQERLYLSILFIHGLEIDSGTIITTGQLKKGHSDRQDKQVHWQGKEVRLVPFSKTYL